MAVLDGQDITDLHDKRADGALVRIGIGLADWAERCFPDAFVIALLGLLVMFAAGVAIGTPLRDLVRYFGERFWGLIPLTMQMALIVIGGFTVATSPPVHRLILTLADVPATPKSAVVVALFSMLSSMISWGFGLVMTGLLVRAIAGRVKRVDYRAIGAAGYLGLGTVRALGLSSSPALYKMSGVIPLSETIYSWQSLTTAAVLIVVSTVIAYFSMPRRSHRTAESFGVRDDFAVTTLEPRRTWAEWLEYSPLLSILISALGFAYLEQVMAARGLRSAVDLNTFNFTLLMVGLLLHWRPRSFLRVVNQAVPATASVLLQFPFYGGSSAS